MNKDQKGFGVIEGILILVVVAILGLVGFKAYQNYTTKDADNSQQVTKKTNKTKDATPINSVELAGYLFELPEGWSAKINNATAQITPNVDFYIANAAEYEPVAKASNVQLMITGDAISGQALKKETTSISGVDVTEYVDGEGTPDGSDVNYIYARTADSKIISARYLETSKGDIANESALKDFRQQLRQIVASGKLK